MAQKFANRTRFFKEWKQINGLKIHVPKSSNCTTFRINVEALKPLDMAPLNGIWGANFRLSSERHLKEDADLFLKNFHIETIAFLLPDSTRETF